MLCFIPLLFWRNKHLLEDALTLASPMPIEMSGNPNRAKYASAMEDMFSVMM